MFIPDPQEIFRRCQSDILRRSPLGFVQDRERRTHATTQSLQCDGDERRGSEGVKNRDCHKRGPNQSLICKDLHEARLTVLAFFHTFLTNPRGGRTRPNRLKTALFDALSAIRYYEFAGWSSLVARWAHNPKVEGSNPSPATNSFLTSCLFSRLVPGGRANAALARRRVGPLRAPWRCAMVVAGKRGPLMAKNTISRRTFLGAAVASTAAAQAATTGAEALPTRVLGRTGVRVSMLAIGCGSRLTMYGDEEKGVEALDLAIRSGITYMDTAQSYGGGKSESWVGKAIQGRRDDLFVATKTSVRTADEVFRNADESLKRLGIDRLDLLHLHSLQGPDDLEAVEKNKVMEALYKLRDQGITRFIGISSHSDPETLAKALGRYDVDCTQMALNAALQGMKNGKGKMVINPVLSTSFEEVALPVAKKKNLGVIAMKAFGQEDIISTETPAHKLLRYSLSLPVSVVTVGVPKHEYLKENVATARAFTPMPADEMKEFSHRAAARYKMALDQKFATHVDA